MHHDSIRGRKKWVGAIPFVDHPKGEVDSKAQARLNLHNLSLTQIRQKDLMLRFFQKES